MEATAAPIDPGSDVPMKKMERKSVTAADAEFLELMDTSADRVVDLHRSNLLRLQMDELLNETLLSMDPTEHTQAGSTKWSTSASDYVQEVMRVLENISLSMVKIQDQSSPFTMCSDKLKMMDHLSSQKKLSVRLKGCSAANIGFTKPAGNAQVLPTLDLVVMIPTKDFMESKDFIRHRYFDKRNAVVWYVAQQLSQKKHARCIGDVYWRGSRAHPTLLLIPPTEAEVLHETKKLGKRAKSDANASAGRKTKRLRFRLELHFRMDNMDWIQPRIRLVPNRCNLSDIGQSHMYNHLLTNDASHCFMDDLSSQNLGHCRELKDSYPRWNEVVVLAKIWCLQRGILNRHDGLTVDHIAMLFLYIYRAKLAGPRMGTQQVLASWFKLLVETDWLGEQTAMQKKILPESESNLIRKAPSDGYQGDGLNKLGRRSVLVLPREGKTTSQTISEAEMAKAYLRQTAESPLTQNDPKTLIELYETSYTLGPVFLDPSMTYNYLGGVSPACMRLIQQEAKKGLDYLHSSLCTKPFALLFMSDVRFSKRYDGYMQIPLKEFSFKSSALWGDFRQDLGDYECISRGLVSILKRALGDRVTDIQIMSTGNRVMAPNTPIDATQDSDEIPSFRVSLKSQRGEVHDKSPSLFRSPTGSDFLVLGISLNPNTCFRIVDRGPPADDSEATEQFLQLWGKEKAELRRFKDGAIVYAAVWDSKIDNSCEMTGNDRPYIRFQNDDKVQGGIVERIIRHILKVHFMRKKSPVTACFALRDILSTVDGVIPTDDKTVTFNPLVAHRMAMKAFEDLSDFLRKESLPSVPVPATDKLRSRLGIPLPIDAVEPLDPALRYAELFPPIPHPFLGGAALPGIQKASGAVCSNPIKIQIRFGSSSKWPTDLKAIGAAKTAMLIQLLDGIEEIQKTGKGVGFEGPAFVTPEYADICYKGYVFRVLVRADPELKLLRELGKPSEEALCLLTTLTKNHVVASKHHSMVHAVYTSHPSSSMAVRLAHRWMSTHLFSGLIPFEAVELMVVHTYTSRDCALNTPATVIAGVTRFFHLLASHDWTGEPLIVDPQSHLDDDDRMDIRKDFEKCRGPKGDRGPPMFIVAPYDRSILEDQDDTTASAKKSPNTRLVWYPTYTNNAPEAVVLGRARQLADRAYSYLCRCLGTNAPSSETKVWSSLFKESAESFRAYSALLRVDSDFIMDSETSSTGNIGIRKHEKLEVLQSTYTRSMYQRYYGPHSFQVKLFKNLIEQRDQSTGILLAWNPVNEMVDNLRKYFGEFAVFWYNHLCPEVVTVLWRPGIFMPKSFSAVSSEYVRPVAEDQWQKDTLVTLSVGDLMREMSCYMKDIIIDRKVLDTGMKIPSMKKESDRKRKATVKVDTSEDDGNSDEDDKVKEPDSSEDYEEECDGYSKDIKVKAGDGGKGSINDESSCDED